MYTHISSPATLWRGAFLGTHPLFHGGCAARTGLRAPLSPPAAPAAERRTPAPPGPAPAASHSQPPFALRSFSPSRIPKFQTRFTDVISKNRTASLCFYRDGRKTLPLRRLSFGALFEHHKIEDWEGGGPGTRPSVSGSGAAPTSARPRSSARYHRRWPRGARCGAGSSAASGAPGRLRAAGCGELGRRPQLFTDGRQLRAGAGSRQRWGESGGPVGKGAAGGGIERAGGGGLRGEGERESGGRRPPAKGGSRGAGLTPPC